MKFNKFLFVILAAAALSLTIGSSVTLAQPYFTNATMAYGEQQYNQSYPTALQPSKTLAAQYSAGTLAGSMVPGTVPVYPNAYTNYFGTNIFSVAPYVVATTSLTNNAPAITGITTTYFTVALANTNCTVYWEATGH